MTRRKHFVQFDLRLTAEEERQLMEYESTPHQHRNATSLGLFEAMRLLKQYTVTLKSITGNPSWAYYRLSMTLCEAAVYRILSFSYPNATARDLDQVLSWPTAEPVSSAVGRAK